MENELPIIKHIVLSGGGQSIFTFYGVIKESNERGLWNISNIESIYGTSAGDSDVSDYNSTADGDGSGSNIHFPIFNTFNDFEKYSIYFFADTDWLKEAENSRAELGRSLRGPLFDHNQIFTTKKYFWDCNGYNETYIGYYGEDGTLIANPEFNYNVSEYEVINVRDGKKNIGNTDDNRKDLLGRGLKNKWKIPKKEIHNKKLTFPWVKIK